MTEVTAKVMQQFLSALGRCYRYPGKLFLVGGSSLALVAAKVSTLDIDIQLCRLG